MADSKQTKGQVRKEGQRVRTPLGGMRLKLQLSDEDMAEFKRRRMVTRWVNDRDGRVEQALAGGYSYVDPKYAKSLGQSAILEGNTDEGSRVSKVVTKGNDLVMRAFLMEIPKKLYDQDQQAKEDLLLEQEKGLIEGHAGGAEIDNQYGPGVTFTRP
jgi:hypothetical protein